MSIEATTPTIEQGAYEVLRARLLDQARALRAGAEDLNRRRQELFGGQDLEVLGNERIRTEDNCVPRDIVSVGERLLFGYNVFHGLRDTTVRDVLSLHTFERSAEGSFAFKELDPADTFLADERFVRDFQEMYLYYKGVRLLQLRELPGRLLAVFQTGSAASDTRVLRFEVDAQGQVSYLDNRGERDNLYPPAHDFEWVATTRNDFVQGKHPHVSVQGEVFVETVGGDLTIKIENNTESGLGILAEPVDDPHQSLADAQILHARVGGVILLRVLPYREKTWRHFLFNTSTREVHRVDAVGQSCVRLPEDHGLIFPGGCYLQEGSLKTFEGDFQGMVFLSSVKSPNGEDVLFVFRNPDTGRNALLCYNLIRKEVRPPIHCHGDCLFDDGVMVAFQARSDEPVRMHAMQVWQTPFSSAEHAAFSAGNGTYLEKIGNAQLVRGVSDCLGLARRVEEQKPSLGVYQDLVASCQRTLDFHPWLSHEQAGGLQSLVGEVGRTAGLVLEEFDKVQTLRRQAADAVEKASSELQTLARGLHPEDWPTVDRFVEALGQLRSQRGRVITLKDQRYADLPRLEALEAEAVGHFDRVSGKAVEFLQGELALKPYLDRIRAEEARVTSFQKATDADPSLKELSAIGEGLELLTDVIGTLRIDDATVRTAILERIAEAMGLLNRARALVQNRRRDLGAKESQAEFGAQFQLFGQAVTSALGLADTPEKCDSALSRLMLQLEELEGRFGEYEDFLGRLVEKREDVYKTLSARKQTLMEQRQRRVQQVLGAADRILEGIARRAGQLGTTEELNTYFASDSMVMKVRDLADRLRDLGDPVKADELEARLKVARQDSGRSLRDRQDLFEEGAAVVRLGRHRFSVNTDPVELTVVPRSGKMCLHLTGTDFYEEVEDEAFATSREFWDQELVSETPEVYRAEYLASSVLAEAEAGQAGLSLERLGDVLLQGGERREDEVHPGLVTLVREYASTRYDEGYERGIHDVDGARILETLLGLYRSAGLLRYAPRLRAAASLFWALGMEPREGQYLQAQARSLSLLESLFGPSDAPRHLAEELSGRIRAFLEGSGWDLGGEELRQAGEYLARELGAAGRFAASGEAVALREAFMADLRRRGRAADLEGTLEGLGTQPWRQFHLVRAWLVAFTEGRRAPALDEAVVLMLTEGRLDRQVTSAAVSASVRGLLGQHPRIAERTLDLRLDEFNARLGAFRRERVPGFRRYQELRHRLIQAERGRMRLDEVAPKVMSAFVRNKLIDEVYLPLVGDNLAKQMGSVGAERRTDQMGMLLLVSPPGYGKTTLMEYVASRLGLVFVKVNGPALGHGVTSLDPAEAPNLTARQEVEKVNFALEMGNNVMLYLDDIQHTNPEFLQKFISLCDAQRKVEGVWKGRTRTCDLKGKRFCICMAGNPYTESGSRFQIPDMLANRADTYNLGEVLAGKESLFELSYLENALTSNPVLAPLTSREPEDVYKLIRMAEGVEIPASELAHAYAPVELEEILAVLRKLLSVQKVLLQVNREYIRSAAMDDRDREEPPFKLQGSYRNMNKLAEKVVPIMNEDELERVVDDHYQGEAQTLTTGAEQNLLKLADLRGRQTSEQIQRWQDIKKGFTRRLVAGGDDADPVNRVTGVLARVSQQLQDLAGTCGPQLEGIREALGSPRDYGPELGSLREALGGLQAPEYRAELQALGQTLAGLRLPDPAPELGELRRALEALGGGPGLEPLRQALTGLRLAVEDSPRATEEALAPHLAELTRAVVAAAEGSAVMARSLPAAWNMPAAPPVGAPVLAPAPMPPAPAVLPEAPATASPAVALGPAGQPASAAIPAEVLMGSMDTVIQLVPRLRDLARILRGPRSKAILLDPELVRVFDALQEAENLSDVLRALHRDDGERGVG